MLLCDLVSRVHLILFEDVFIFRLFSFYHTPDVLLTNLCAVYTFENLFIWVNYFISSDTEKMANAFKALGEAQAEAAKEDL